MSAEDILTAVMAETNWTREETRNVLKCIRAESADALLENVPDIIGWAMRVEIKHAILHLIKTLPPGVLECQWINGDIELRISPDAEVNTLPGGVLDIVTRGAK